MKILKILINYIFKKLGYTILSNDHKRLEKPGHIEDKILKHLINSQNPICFDVGGHKGETIQKYIKLFSQSYIYSFEPTKNLYDSLKNYYLKSKNIKIENFAISDFEGESSFYIQKYQNFNSLNLLQGGKNIEEKVKVTTLDKYCQKNNIQKIDLLKIDTQGNDTKVLKGAEHILKNTKVVITEITLNNSYGFSNSLLNIEKYLTGFKLYDITKKVNHKDEDISHNPHKVGISKNDFNITGNLSWCNVVYFNEKFFRK